MDECLLVYRSMTYAQRTARALEQAGLRGYVTKLKNVFQKEGCTYGVNIQKKILPNALEALKNKDLAPEEAYFILKNGTYQEISL